MTEPVHKADWCRAAAAITVAAVRAARQWMPMCAATLKVEKKPDGSIRQEADLAASRLAQAGAAEKLPGFTYIDEEIADDIADRCPDPESLPAALVDGLSGMTTGAAKRIASQIKAKAEGAGLAAAMVRRIDRVALGDPIDGSNAYAKTARRLAAFRDWDGRNHATDGDWVDQYSSTLVLWEHGQPIVAAVATARARVFVSDCESIRCAEFSWDANDNGFDLRDWRVPDSAIDKRLVLLGATKDLPIACFKCGREEFSYQRLGHFATDLVELLCGSVVAFLSGSEKIWDYSVAVPFVQASAGKLEMCLFDDRKRVESIPRDSPARFYYPAKTPVRMEWKGGARPKGRCALFNSTRRCYRLK